MKTNQDAIEELEKLKQALQSVRILLNPQKATAHTLGIVEDALTTVDQFLEMHHRMKNERPFLDGIG